MKKARIYPVVSVLQAHEEENKRKIRWMRRSWALSMHKTLLLLVSRSKRSNNFRHFTTMYGAQTMCKTLLQLIYIYNSFNRCINFWVVAQLLPLLHRWRNRGAGSHRFELIALYHTILQTRLKIIHFLYLQES